MSADQKQLLRQLEGHMRQRSRMATTRKRLIQTGMTQDEIWAFEHTVRRQIRDERNIRKENA